MQGDFSGKPGRARTEKGRSITDCLVEPRSGGAETGGSAREWEGGWPAASDQERDFGLPRSLHKASVGTKHTTLKGGLQQQDNEHMIIISIMCFLLNLMNRVDFQ